MCGFDVILCITGINKNAGSMVASRLTKGAVQSMHIGRISGIRVPAESSTGGKARDRCPPREHRALPQSRAPGIFCRTLENERGLRRAQGDDHDNGARVQEAGRARSRRAGVTKCQREDSESTRFQKEWARARERQRVNGACSHSPQVYMRDGDTDWGWGILVSASRKKLTGRAFL